MRSMEVMEVIECKNDTAKVFARVTMDINDDGENAHH